MTKFFIKTVWQHPDPVLAVRAVERFKEVAGHLGVEPRRIRWLEATSEDLVEEEWPHEFYGYTPEESTECPLPRDVDIVLGRPEHDLLETIAHECFHIQQNRQRGSSWRHEHECDAEKDAYEFQASEYVKTRIAEITATR